jgi:hypothetical protein
MLVHDASQVVLGADIASTIKKIPTQETVLYHKEESFTDLQKPIDSFMKRVDSVQFINPKNLMFAKFKARMEAKLKRCQGTAMSTPQRTPSPSNETTPLTNSPFSVGQGIAPF